MVFAGIDLHKRDLVIALEDASGPLGRPRRFACRDAQAIAHHLAAHRPFRAVIEASSSYRWLYDLLRPLGDVVLAHPLRLRAIVSARAKTDKLDASRLARLLKLGEIPEAYIPPERYDELRQFTRSRARLSRRVTRAVLGLHHLAAWRNVHSPYKKAFGPRGRRWIASLDLGVSGNLERDDLLGWIEHAEASRDALDAVLCEVAKDFPETEALTDIHGIGLYSALLIVAEIGEPERFGNAAGGRLCGTDGAGQAVGRPRVSRPHHAPGLVVVAMDSGAGGVQGGTPGREDQAVPRADSEAIEQAHCSGGRRAQAGRHLLGSAAAVASRTRRGRLRRDRAPACNGVVRGPVLVTGERDAIASRMRRYCDWAGRRVKKIMHGLRE